MTYHIGDVVPGRVTGIQPYGAFIALDEEHQGLIHISECQHGFVSDIHHLLKVGQLIDVQILDIDEYSKKISLSLRSLEKLPYNSQKFRRKHYWTSREEHFGFQPIAERLPGWIEQALKDFSEA
ncbi:CvfD/Ygs/GSP13 family RNA-binding post-transcriptional regulator [Loigolactobacillus bifermentans]|uniref:RNA binding protein (S1 domain) n=1 Tax=Loigolactobacillus bifermentans DSM 20003 TaxID=1423726 RepID=A0A0R1GS18_9LACO|nr:CvfD/Ygs/GSP13 family RNA-binding post-transcriptional regulator [Loigolactobacillus bifermentans]KRK36940.1 RNA binding protein (S1 domain) [Loigolactobacillus bifermentans DSM 20003]QGG59773.1 S1 RNA-binding domain-containing protein [Loigolactobacillus bifermentans]